MTIGPLRVCDDVTPSQWIAPRLSGEFGWVTRHVPSGYPSYARILHPAHDDHVGGEATTWADVAAMTGRTVHALAQWWNLVGAADPHNPRGGVWRGEQPALGKLDRTILAPLLAILEAHTESSDSYFCLWDGYAWVGGGRAVSPLAAAPARGWRARRPRHEPPVAGAYSPEELARPRVRLPQRNYLLLAGPLDGAAQIADDLFGHAWPQSPNIFWPTDRSWCVASEIDFDSTLVGGSDELVAAILNDTGIEAFRVQPTDSLAFDADRINGAATIDP